MPKLRNLTGKVFILAGHYKQDSFTEVWLDGKDSLTKIWHNWQDFSRQIWHDGQDHITSNQTPFQVYVSHSKSCERRIHNQIKFPANLVSYNFS